MARKQDRAKPNPDRIPTVKDPQQNREHGPGGILGLKPGEKTFDDSPPKPRGLDGRE